MGSFKVWCRLKELYPTVFAKCSGLYRAQVQISDPFKLMGGLRFSQFQHLGVHHGFV